MDNDAGSDYFAARDLAGVVGERGLLEKRPALAEQLLPAWALQRLGEGARGEPRTRLALSKTAPSA